ncbi:unnamed protein product [Prorocentrum cordatum]|uniref:Uncharacterized protein n=1 Tax=Prorocentrum cordatum TaxID=2364126 RepID=A0ABN9SUY9_9DINO|nr:unnamed protein product [Polarella glacialis]
MTLDHCPDFALAGAAAPTGAPASVEKPKDQKKREWLKVYETLPAQLLNVYGPSKFAKLKDAQEPERRGVGINRFIHAMKTFCEYQKDPSVMAGNKAVLKEQMYNDLYKEIDEILPALQYCLAPEKQPEKKGAALLRASGTDDAVLATAKTGPELDKYAKQVYDWLDKTKLSRVRMMANWQSCGGLAFVAQCHHRATTCFRYHGNSFHGAGPSQHEVSLQDFQAAVKLRHSVGHNGMDVEGVSEVSGVNDFGSS